MKKYVKARHKFYFAFVRPIARIIARKSYYKTKPVRLPKGKNFLILSNHQNFWDPVFMGLTIKAPIYFVTSDVLHSQKWYSKLLYHCFAPINKRKGFADTACIRTMCQVAKEGGNVAIFPEGNRQWSDSMFYIDRAIVKLVRLMKLPVILYNISGGYAVKPRWGNAKRKGKYVGFIRETISWEEITAMSDDELFEKIKSGLKVIDSMSGERYESDQRAEYLERVLFVCPKCGAESTLHSHGNDVKCSNCGLTVTYGEDLHLTSPDPDFRFDRLVDWYEFQQKYVREYDLENANELFSDEGVTLYDKTEQERVQVAQGKLTLTKDALTVGEWSVPTSEIISGSTQDSDKLLFNVGTRSYMAVGTERFNSIKYLLFFNRVCKLLAEHGGDKYYGLYIDPSLK